MAPRPKKVEDIVMALKRENPSWPKSRIYATAWSAYNKTKGGK
jgi:hypothetical protein